MDAVAAKFKLRNDNDKPQAKVCVPATFKLVYFLARGSTRSLVLQKMQVCVVTIDRGHRRGRYHHDEFGHTAVCFCLCRGTLCLF